MGETRVDLQHLLEDLRDAYTGALEETILTEAVANALDSGATRVSLRTNAADATLTIVDDGRGMQRRELARYHDVAASAKKRGEGIGFAGVGIKLGLLVSREVITETRRGATHVATRWHLASRHRAPWKWMRPPGLTTGRGTAVQLLLTNPLSPLLDGGYLEATIRRHFEPLLDSAFDDQQRRHYPNGVAFEVDNQTLARAATSSSERVPIAISGRGDERVPAPLFVNVPVGHELTGDGPISPSGGGGTSQQTEGALPSTEPLPPPEVLAAEGQSGDENEPRAPEEHPQIAASAGNLDTVTGRRRPARYGLMVQFESRPDDSELARLVDSTIRINDAHRAYARAVASRLLGYHTALAVALARAPLAVEARDEHTFITEFLAHWGRGPTASRTRVPRRTSRTA